MKSNREAYEADRQITETLHWQSSQKRCLLLTDSLGCPRQETIVEKTWTDRIIRNKSGKFYFFYTYCSHGLSSKKLPLDYIEEIEPDVIIIQIGVVDACRRAMPAAFEKIISKIPVLKRIIHAFCRKYHYSITKMTNIHYATLKEMKNACLQIIARTKAKICFIAIGPGGTIMNNKTYHFSDDVAAYNQMLEKISNQYKDRVTFVDPYENSDPNTLFLDDGHHLNEFAIDLVYKAAADYLDKCKNETDKENGHGL